MPSVFFYVDSFGEFGESVRDNLHITRFQLEIPEITYLPSKYYLVLLKSK